MEMKHRFISLATASKPKITGLAFFCRPFHSISIDERYHHRGHRIKYTKVPEVVNPLTWKYVSETRVFDVSGQRGARKKWIQLFDNVTAILFLVDSSSFDQTLREDRNQNRMVDSLEVFEQAWNNK
ncbi:hypothetical protein X801_00713 [Opisthorchis viverrini]|uniref:G-protein alpha subunit n=1 Tax=Opisthorchis viverrini TaxID=6198 RepID=A0A1S8X9K4_OPIVI|nr:hypothetical protein X801_00713 [Opisthorchis viverrini]